MNIYERLVSKRNDNKQQPEKSVSPQGLLELELIPKNISNSNSFTFLKQWSVRHQPRKQNLELIL